MSELFENAIKSIILGVEDFETGTDERMLSAARNYYAGLLLLAKECLVRAAPKANAMEVIGAKFKPIPDGIGGVDHVLAGFNTIGISELQGRFKDFNLPWPDANIKNLQDLRNRIEHYHLEQPASAVGEAIASSFQMVVDFFNLLNEDPQVALADVWDTILEQRDAFERVQKTCLAGLENVDWPAAVSQLDRMACPGCGSSLVGQSDQSNRDHERVVGKCYQCGIEIAFEQMMEMLVASSYEADAYIRAKEGLHSPIANCPFCSVEAYVESGEISICFACRETLDQNCEFCGDRISVSEYNHDYPDACGYCAYRWEKAMRE